MQPNGKEVKIAVLQTEMKEVKDDIRSIKTNHIPHLDAKIDLNHREVMHEIEKLGSAVNVIRVRTAYYVGGATVLWALIQLAVAWKK